MNMEEVLQHESSLLTAVLANRIWLTVTDGIVRIAFAEENTAAHLIVGRCAVVLSYENASALANLINQYIKKLEVH
jgi:hypothetical protein